MIKSTLTILTLGALAVTSMQAGDKACCASNGDKTANEQKCRADYAKLNLSPEQKSQMDTLLADCTKNGCTKESMATFMQKAEGVLSKEQFESFKTECMKAGHDEKAQS